MTLKEIAKEAGVSISTVSRVINNNDTRAASKEVQERLWEIVRRTGYVPNTSARELKMKVLTHLSYPTQLHAYLPEQKILNRIFSSLLLPGALSKRRLNVIIF